MFTVFSLSGPAQIYIILHACPGGLDFSNQSQMLRLFMARKPN